MSNLIHIDTAYRNWIADLSARFKQSQIRAVVRVNNELLSFYWQLGKDIVELDAESEAFLPQPGVKSKEPQDILTLFSIPWTHHKYILDKYKNNPE